LVRIRALRWCIAAALVATTGAAGATGGVGASTPRACAGIALAGGGWIAVSVPQLPTITQVRSPTYAPDRIYATDGHGNLARSDDDGCSWSDVSPVAPPLVSGVDQAPQALTITSLAVPSSATSAGYLYIGADIAATDKLPVSLPAQPYVYASQTGGRPYTASGSGNGLPPVGHVQDVAASDLSPRTVYAMITGAGSNSGLWVSTDAANSWTGPKSTDTTLTSLRVDPNVANSVYALKPGVGLVLSRDGGAHFAPAPETDPDVPSFAAASGSGGVQIAQGHGSTGVIELTTDGGHSWRAVSVTAQKARNVAVAAVVPVVAAYDDQKLSIVRATGCAAGPLRLTPGVGTPQDGSLEMSAPTGVGLALTGIARDGQHVLRSVFDSARCAALPASVTPIHLLPHVTVKQFPSELTAAFDKAVLPSGGSVQGNRVDLPAGTSADVAYDLLLPRTPSPVDLMFLVDTSYSTDQMIDGVRQGLQTVVNELGSTGLDVQLGLGDFKDYPASALGGGDDGDYPYRLRRAIGPPDVSLQVALSRLQAGGGGDQAESDLAALYYSTVGTGQKIGGRWVIRPGATGYRPSSLRLAMLTTDEMFHTEYDDPGPSWRKTVAALVAYGVRQVGLAVNSSGDVCNPAPPNCRNEPVPGLYDSLPDQRRMARDTGALAPPGGVDCDGNGTTDIPAGQPLVCTIPKPADHRQSVPTSGGGPTVVVGSPPPPVHLAPMVVQLAGNIPDLRPVALHVAGAPTGGATVVSHPAAPTVNLRVDNTLSYVVRYTCPRSTKPRAWPLTLTADAAGRALASTRTTLACGAVPVAGVVPPLAAAALPAAVAPGAPPNPPTNVNANFNPNPAVNPNAGFAAQDEEQMQLATVDADEGLVDEPGTSLAMSRRSGDEHAAWMLGAAGLMAAAGAAYGTRSRWRTARQHW
jgi:hypothetical protein